MFDRSHLETRLGLANIMIVGTYVSIISSILFLIYNYQLKEDIIESLEGKVESALASERINGTLIAVLLLVTSSILLYNAYVNLQLNIDTYEKTGVSTSLESSKLGFYAALLLFSGTIINLYNTIVNPGAESDILL